MSPVVATVVIAGLGTFGIRWSFLAFAHRATDLPPTVLRALRMIPPAALAALVTPAVFRPEGSVDLWSAELLAAGLAALVGWRTRSVGLPMVVGLVALGLLRAF